MVMFELLTNQCQAQVSLGLHHYNSSTLCIPGAVLLTLTNLTIETRNNGNQGNVTLSFSHDKLQIGVVPMPYLRRLVLQI